jgi:hypothetical protein
MGCRSFWDDAKVPDPESSQLNFRLFLESGFAAAQRPEMTTNEI